MEPMKFAKQIMDFNKATFDTTFNTFVSFQEQTEKMMNAFLEQSPWFPEEGKRVLSQSTTAYKRGREEFKRFVDEGYKKVDSYFSIKTAS